MAMSADFVEAHSISCARLRNAGKGVVALIAGSLSPALIHRIDA